MLKYKVFQWIAGQLPSTEPEEPEDREKAAEEEKLRKEAMREAEEKRRVKHKKLEEEREGVRQNIREKVYWSNYFFINLTSKSTWRALPTFICATII